MSRFDYVKYDDRSNLVQSAFKKQFENLTALAESALKPGRAQALVLTKLEEAYMWVGKSIRDTQVDRGPAEPQEERKDG